MKKINTEKKELREKEKFPKYKPTKGNKKY